MATYTITTQANSFDITKDGETREYPFNELIVQVDDLDVDTLTLFNKRSLIIDYYIYTTTDTINVNGVTVFADAEALKTEIDEAIFNSGGGGVSVITDGAEQTASFNIPVGSGDVRYTYNSAVAGIATVVVDSCGIGEVIYFRQTNTAGVSFTNGAGVDAILNSGILATTAINDYVALTRELDNGGNQVYTIV